MLVCHRLFPPWCVAALAALATVSYVAAEADLLLATESVGDGSVLTKLIVLHRGEAPGRKAPVELRFLVADHVLSEPAPGFRTTVMMLDTGSWLPGHTQILAPEPFSPQATTPQQLRAEARIGDGAFIPLGRLTRAADGAWRLARACTVSEKGRWPVITVAHCRFLEPEQVLINVGFLNCGAEFERDYWAFVHLDLGPAGEDLSGTAALGLPALALVTDSSAWADDDVTVMSFGPYDLPSDLASPLFVSVGLYDQNGDGSRAPLVGCDRTMRVPVGQLMPRADGWRYERAPTPGQGVVP